MAKCEACGGWGRFDDIPCPKCNGTGEAPETTEAAPKDPEGTRGRDVFLKLLDSWEVLALQVADEFSSDLAKDYREIPIEKAEWIQRFDGVPAAPAVCPHCSGPLMLFEGEMECVSCGRSPSEEDEQE